MKALLILALALFTGQACLAQDALAGEEMGAVGDSSGVVPNHGSYSILIFQVPIAVNFEEINQSIKYPNSLRQTGITGKVIVRVELDSVGNHIKYVTLKSPHPDLTKAALDGIYRLKYCMPKPGSTPINYSPVEVIDFNIKQPAKAIKPESK